MDLTNEEKEMISDCLQIASHKIHCSIEYTKLKILFNKFQKLEEHQMFISKSELENLAEHQRFASLKLEDQINELLSNN